MITSKYEELTSLFDLRLKIISVYRLSKDNARQYYIMQYAIISM